MDSNTSMELDITSRQYLTETSKWANFLAILGYISLGLIMIVGVGMVITFATIGDQMPGMGGIAIWGIALAYVLVAALYLYPVYSLHQFARLCKKAVSEGNQPALTESFKHLKNNFRYVGILTIIILSLYALVFLLGMLLGGFAM